MAQIHILHENDEWNVPLRAALEQRDLPYQEWFLDRGTLNLSEPPPEGVFYSRMSASSHTRDHRYAPEYTAAVLAWLERHGRRVLNPSRALQLELSKVAQQAALETQGIRTPKTVAAVGRESILDAANHFNGPFITKHNRAGKGLGVRLFHNKTELARYLDGPEFEPSIDGITLVQDYIQAPQPFITRVEFIGQEFLYAVRVDTTDGFELCPADACAIDGEFCPTNEVATNRFIIYENFRHPLLERYQRLLKAEGVDVASFEFIVDEQGNDFTYDINTNTNYNSAAETNAGVSGMARLAEFLGDELAQLEKDYASNLAVS